MTVPRVECPACGGAAARPAVVARDLRFRRCRGCASLFVENPPPRSVTASLYRDERYFARRRLGPPGEGGVCGYRDYLADRDGIEAKFDRILARLERHVEPGELLDVGAGPGLMVAAAERRGWRASGVDLNPWAARYAGERIGVEVRPGTLAAAGLERGRFHAVTMLDLLEHEHDPGATLAEAARVTRPGGLLAVLTPDAGAPLSRLLGRRWPEVMRAPGHLVLFSVSGLSRLIERHGYEVLERHSVGKTACLATLHADVAPAAPAAARLVAPLLARGPLARRVVTLDPRTKFCLYARRRG
jgi:SAM-dependent methyltransferase